MDRSKKCAALRVAALVAHLCAWALLWAASEAACADRPEKILVLPFRVLSGQDESELQSFSQHAESRIRAAIGNLGDNFTIQDEYSTGKLIEEKGLPLREEEVRELAQRTDADLVVYGFLAYEASQYHLKGIMWDLREKRPSVSTDLKVNNIHGLPGVLQVFIQSLTTRLHGSPRLQLYKTEPEGSEELGRSSRPPTLVDLPRSFGPWRSPEISGALSSVDVGDIDGDGKNETVFLQAAEISITRFDKGSLRTLTQYSESPAGYLNVEVWDLDGDGVSELLLTYQTPTGLESAIARYVNRNFEVSQKVPHVILRVIADPRDSTKNIMVGQATDKEDMFNGQMLTYRFEGGKIVEGGTIQLPPGTFLLSYVSGWLGKPKEFLQVVLNQDQRLMVFDAENRLLGGVPDRIYGLNRRISIPGSKKRGTLALPGRMLIADTDGDGEHELLVIKQRDRTSMIQGLSWNDNNLTDKWKTVPSQGIISDFRIRDFKNEGIRSLVILLVKTDPLTLLTGPRSVVYAYDMVP